MSNNVNWGCILSSIATTVVLAFLIILPSGLISNSNTATPLPTLVAAVSSTASTPPLFLTTPPQETEAYFVLANNQITYTFTPTLGNPCYYVVAGRVFDLQGEPFSNFVVNIKMLDEIAPTRPGYAFPGEGGHAQDGPSRWISMLPQSPVEYEIWLTTEVGGDELSTHVIVPPQDCDHNMAIVDFIQIRTLP